jgi:hypothetical protein
MENQKVKTGGSKSSFEPDFEAFRRAAWDSKPYSPVETANLGLYAPK